MMTSDGIIILVMGEYLSTHAMIIPVINGDETVLIIDNRDNDAMKM